MWGYPRTGPAAVQMAVRTRPEGYGLSAFNRR